MRKDIVETLAQVKERLLPRLHMALPEIIKDHIDDMRHRTGEISVYIEEIEENAFTTMEQNVGWVFSTIFLDEECYQIEKQRIAETGYQRGAAAGQQRWTSKDVILEMNHNSRLYILHYFLNIIEHEKDWSIKKLLLERLNELNSIRFINYVNGYLSIKDEQIDTLHQQKINVIGQMAAGMAHEIRNPLTSFQGFMQLMKETLKNERYEKEKFLQYLEICQEEIASLEGLVSNFLILARKNEETEKKLQMLDLTKILNRIHSLSEHFVIEKDVHLTFHYQHEGIPILGISSYIEQIGLNLIKNAVDAVPVGGVVQVETSCDHEQQAISLIVRDNGCGIPEERMKYMFEPFYTTKEKGTGIGLSVCKKLIEEMGGTIHVTSSLYRGTMVEVRLKMMEPPLA